MKKIALLGFGVVGGGVAEVLTKNKSIIESRLGEEIEIKYILDLRDFPDSPFADRIVHDFDTILNDPEISTVAEMMGGSHPAYDFSRAALLAGKNVVTSNKEVVAKFGAELLALAERMGVRYLFEASVGGGIPIIRPICHDLVSNEITEIDGILNGTTNYILTLMEKSGASFSDALADARAKGYAEADPSSDIEGIDAARKIAILSALAFGKCIPEDKIERCGIANVSSDDFAVARALGCSVKLIAHSERCGEQIYARVSPCFVRSDNPLSHISDVYNGILVGANMLDKVLFYGKGAGKLPTASAVVADIIDIAERSGDASCHHVLWRDAEEADIAERGALPCELCVIVDGRYDGGDYFPELDKTAIILDGETAEASTREIERAHKIYRII